MLNAPAKIATFWFIPEHRPLAIAGLSLMKAVGVGIGFVIPGLVVENYDDRIFSILHFKNLDLKNIGIR